MVLSFQPRYFPVGGILTKKDRSFLVASKSRVFLETSKILPYHNRKGNLPIRIYWIDQKIPTKFLPPERNESEAQGTFKS